MKSRILETLTIKKKRMKSENVINLHTKSGEEKKSVRRANIKPM